jgi:hypothetical protein
MLAVKFVGSKTTYASEDGGVLKEKNNAAANKAVNDLFLRLMMLDPLGFWSTGFLRILELG